MPSAREVEPREAALRELLGHQVDGVALPASDVADVDALAQPVDQPVDERKLTLDQRSVVDLTASSRPSAPGTSGTRVGHASTLPEAGDDVVLHTAHQRLELGHVRHCSVPPPVSATRRARAAAGSAARVVVDETADGHRVQPLPDVTLIKPAAGDLRAGRRRQPPSCRTARCGDPRSSSGPT